MLFTRPLWFAQVGLLCITFSPHVSADEKPKATGKLSIQVKAKNANQSLAIPVTMDKVVCGTSRPDGALALDPEGNLKNAILWLEGKNLRPWPKSILDTPHEKKIEMKNCDFQPRVVLVAPNSSVEFINFDPILHGVRAHSKVNKPLSRMHPPNLASVFLKFEKPEIIPIICDLHPWMKAYVIVAAHPYYAVTDVKGRAEFRQVPYGSYRLMIWHEISGSQIQEENIEIASSSQQISSTLDFSRNVEN